MKKRIDYRFWIPTAIALVGGVFIGYFSLGVPFSSTQSDKKLNTVMNLISQEYIDDSINTQSAIELTIPSILSHLDPYCSYLSAKENAAEQNMFKGQTSGYGISAQFINDTIMIMEVMPSGPSDKAGLKVGDKIVTIDDSTWTGPNVDDDKVNERLISVKGSKMKLGIIRAGADKILSFVITYCDVPLNSVECHYLLDKSTGYIKITQFGDKTHKEMINALNSLKNQGAKRFIIDLRGNGGGKVAAAIAIANEFLPDRALIVSTKARSRKYEFSNYSDGQGQFQNQEIVILIDEYTASASEIFAGAIQDNDRGLIVGCRSFGKGLVQGQRDLHDKSAIWLTIAKYYTPSGRCLQKPYGIVESANLNDILDRHSNGELYNKDNIKIDKSKIFETTTGRKVYGGGGIIPDIFVPRDTAQESIYYKAVLGLGIIQEYALKYATEHHAELKNMTDYKQLLRNLPANEALLTDFVTFAADKGVPARWHYIRQSQDLITTLIKGFIAQDIFGHRAFYPIINRNDKTFEAALKALNKHKAAFPITNY